MQSTSLDIIGVEEKRVKKKTKHFVLRSLHRVVVNQDAASIFSQLKFCPAEEKMNN